MFFLENLEVTYSPRPFAAKFSVNNSGLKTLRPLISLVEYRCSQNVHRRFLVDKLCISNHCWIKEI